MPHLQTWELMLLAGALASEAGSAAEAEGDPPSPIIRTQEQSLEEQHWAQMKTWKESRNTVPVCDRRLHEFL